MFYRITFWIYFIAASIICALMLLINGYTNDFMKLILISFGVGFATSFIINNLTRLVIHSIRWLFNNNNYRERFPERRL